MTDPLPIPDALRNMANLAERADHAEFLRRVAWQFEGLRKAVQIAECIFDEYSRLHLAKGTRDGIAKAQRNEQYADEMREALRATAPASEPKKDRDDG